LLLSLNRYREYEQNTTDNTKGIPLDLLLRITELEGIAPPMFLSKMEETPSPAPDQVDELEQALLNEWRRVPSEDRRTFVRIARSPGTLEAAPSSDAEEPLIPQKMRWIIRVSNLLGQLPYDARMKFEREVIEDYMISSSTGLGSLSNTTTRTLRAIENEFLSECDCAC
jgi:hypothetical protein